MGLSLPYPPACKYLICGGSGPTRRLWGGESNTRKACRIFSAMPSDSESRGRSACFACLSVGWQESAAAAASSVARAAASESRTIDPLLIELRKDTRSDGFKLELRNERAVASELSVPRAMIGELLVPPHMVGAARAAGSARMRCNARLEAVDFSHDFFVAFLRFFFSTGASTAV